MTKIKKQPSDATHSRNVVFTGRTYYKLESMKRQVAYVWCGNLEKWFRSNTFFDINGNINSDIKIL